MRGFQCVCLRSAQLQREAPQPPAFSDEPVLLGRRTNPNDANAKKGLLKANVAPPAAPILLDAASPRKSAGAQKVSFENAPAAPLYPNLLGSHRLPPASRTARSDSRDEESAVTVQSGSRGRGGAQPRPPAGAPSKKACCMEDENEDEASVESTEFGLTTEGGTDTVDDDRGDERREAARTRLAVLGRLRRVENRPGGKSDGLIA